MMRRFKPSPAMVVAVIALFAGLTGGAMAGATLIRTDDIANNAVTSKKVKNRTLTKADFKRGVIRRGRRGPTGAPGAPGAPGSPGRNGARGPAGPTTLYTYSETYANPEGEQSQGSVACDPGEYATGGGVYTESEIVGEQAVNSSGPAFTDPNDAPDAWNAFVDNHQTPETPNNTANDLTFTVVVTCAPATVRGFFPGAKPVGKAKAAAK